jgi:galactitol-specific phosphotransferase system IIC component
MTVRRRVIGDLKLVARSDRQGGTMSKPVLGLVLGAILGVFDGLSALISAPEVASQIMGIVAGSTFKGLVVGVIVGYIAKKKQSLAIGLGAGLALGAFFAWLVTLGEPYFWEIILPGSVLGLIVGYATQRYGRPAAPAVARSAASS